MAEIPLRQLALYAVGLLLVLGLGVRHLGRDGGASTPTASSSAPAGAPAIRVQRGDGGARVIVHVAGAVRRPGVYRLNAGSRVDDAVARAGGATAGADLSAVNLAAKAEDGRQVLVPRRTALPTEAASGAQGTPAAGGSVAAGGSLGAAGTAPAAPVNLGTATLEQLDALDGIGPATAQAILDHRDERGGFGSVEELAQISGIGPKRMATLREQVTP